VRVGIKFNLLAAGLWMKCQLWRMRAPAASFLALCLPDVQV